MNEPTYRQWITKNGQRLFDFEFDGYAGIVYESNLYADLWICLIQLPDGGLARGEGSFRANAVFRAKLSHKAITLKDAICLTKTRP